MKNMETKNTSKSSSSTVVSWIAFAAIVILVIWGLVAAQKKATREEKAVLLPTEIATSTDHIRGSTIAPVTMVEYGDFQCPACGLYHPIVEQVLASTSPDTLRFVFRHFPLTQHANAMSAAQAAEAAAAQGKFWEMHNMLYESQAEWEKVLDPKAIFTGYAQSMGLDVKKFADDYASKATKDKINNDYKGGMRAGINSTPTFFVNGVKIMNPQNYDAFKKLIDNAVPKIAL